MEIMKQNGKLKDNTIKLLLIGLSAILYNYIGDKPIIRFVDNEYNI